MFERSFHFVPANRPDFLAKSGTIGADALIFDLEDAVPAAEKERAISTMARWFVECRLRVPCYVRVNGPHEEWASLETELLAANPHVGIVLPKVASAKSVADALHYYRAASGRKIILLIEDLQAVHHIAELARIEMVAGLGIGFEDLYSSFLHSFEELSLLTNRIRTELALHTAALGIAGIDSISLDLKGGDDLERDALAARSAGLSAKFTIHPGQLPTVHRVFSPSPEQIVNARHITQLAKSLPESTGYHVVDDEILSPPKIKKAETILSYISHHESKH
jgi:citrate lyase subunit beta/citryl-CoA lyase